MAITITLTEAQALEIVSQLVNKKNGGGDAPDEPLAQRIRRSILAMRKGTIFRTTIFLHELGLTEEERKGCGFTSAVKCLVKAGEVKMMQRGTWRRL